MSQCTAELFVPAALRIGHPDRHVDRAADLLVEQDLLGGGGDAEVRADSELAQPARAVVGVEHLDEELLALLGRGVHHLAVLEAHAHAGHGAAAVARREREDDLAVHRVLHRAGEELAVGHVVLAHARDPVAPRHAKRDVGAVRLDADLLLALHPVREPPHLLRLALPSGHRIPVEGEAGRVVEVLVGGQRHARLARKGVRREERERPSVAALGGASHRGLHDLLARLLLAGLLLRVRRGELAGVQRRHHRDVHVGVLDRPLRGRRNPVELLVARQLVERRLSAARLQLHDRQAAGAEDLLVDRLNERLGRGGGGDRAHVALLHPGRVANKDLSERLGAVVPHEAWTLSTSHWCNFRSVPNSGWKATARMFPWRTATG